MKTPDASNQNQSSPASGESVSYRVLDMPARQRPRELVARFGVESVPDETLLAIILRIGVRGVNVMELSRRLLNHYGSLSALARASVDDLVQMRGMGKIKAQVLKAALELAKRLTEESVMEQPVVRTPADAAGLLRESARTLESEVFWVLLLNAKNRIQGAPLEITRGLLDASLAHPREIFRDAVRTASAALVMVHNHPSGDPAPSPEDIRLTKQLVQSGRVIDIRVLDHVIIGKASPARDKDYFSMRESGMVDFS
ncbi:MAG: DNA repair protein RadC [Verrucomicrobia bacterium]|nr:DNA repair protein RadC [Verrucomicrobiota bacterium]MBU4246818.1 DNA repair protein RadC [Verrucomicrobiota bacterium]MBU4291812.1 DNA repair protein RadC [Verrucomicrobiota bacterium]MBU4428237.1 DNA repair protein RadC [Verrucomicrobiota bacterium]MCG2680811.1 DNA repair protein RadC [Kiritimatiellia bacterium]